jgi:CubicO group peptidase (beta-lactamase class C family)
MSGIRHYRNDEEVISTRHYDSVVEALDLFKDDTLMYEPGTAHLYTSYGYNLLGCVVEGASGLSFMEYMHQSIFRPAGMENTHDDDPHVIIANRAAGYRMNERGELLNAYYVDMSNKMPAGGYITTVEDLASFAAAVMNGTLIKHATLEHMLTPQKTTSGEVVPYGLGWGLFPDETWYGEREAFHGGGTPRVSGMLYLLPDRRFAVAILMNLEEVSERTELAAEIAKTVLDLQPETRN